MTQSNSVFALFGLLLGLSIAEVLGGLARLIEARLQSASPVRVGWLTPLLAAIAVRGDRWSRVMVVAPVGYVVLYLV